MRIAWAMPLLLLLTAALAINAEAAAAGQKEKIEEKLVDTEGGKIVLKFIDLTVGTGKEAKKGDWLQIHYTGWLTNDLMFSGSVPGKPFEFTLGARQVIKGWDEGIAGMKEGGKRKLIVPPELGYGKKNGGNRKIPPDSTLIFDVELLKVK